MEKVIPSTSLWSREDFLSARDQQIKSTQSFYADKGKPDYVHIMDPGNEILCDVCNSEICTAHVRLVEFGNRVNCDECFEKWYGKQPVKYRQLNEDGSLGKYVGEDEYNGD